MGRYSGPGNGTTAGSSGSARAGGVSLADVEAARFDGARGELGAIRASLQHQRDRTTSTVRRAILLEIIREIDARVAELDAGEL